MGRIAKHNPDERNHMAIMEIYYRAGKEARKGGREEGKKGREEGKEEDRKKKERK